MSKEPIDHLMEILKEVKEACRSCDIDECMEKAYETYQEARKSFHEPKPCCEPNEERSCSQSKKKHFVIECEGVVHDLYGDGYFIDDFNRLHIYQCAAKGDLMGIFNSWNYLEIRKEMKNEY